jgi:hypothetical protein
MTQLWFVTPAFQRYELSAVCFDQRVRVIEALAEQGVEAHCVVVADDENLDLARERGFAVVERDNEWLGRKFNDGQQYAGEHGAEWIVPIGSDSFIDPQYFVPLPHRRVTRTSHEYAPVEPGRLAELHVGMMGAGPHVFHRSIFPAGFRAAPDKISRNTDSSTIKGLVRPPVWEWRDLHPLQYIGFRHPPFITQYDRLWTRWGVREHTDPWARLAEHYPVDLVERARGILERQ